jgi:hypothetical protein
MSPEDIAERRSAERRAVAEAILRDLQAFCEERGIDIYSCGCDAGIHILKREPRTDSEFQRMLLAHVEVTRVQTRGALREYGEDEDDIVLPRRAPPPPSPPRPLP